MKIGMTARRIVVLLSALFAAGAAPAAAHTTRYAGSYGPWQARNATSNFFHNDYPSLDYFMPDDASVNPKQIFMQEKCAKNYPGGIKSYTSYASRLREVDCNGSKTWTSRKSLLEDAPGDMNDASPSTLNDSALLTKVGSKIELGLAKSGVHGVQFGSTKSVSATDTSVVVDYNRVPATTTPQTGPSVRQVEVFYLAKKRGQKHRRLAYTVATYPTAAANATSSQPISLKTARLCRYDGLRLVYGIGYKVKSPHRIKWGLITDDAVYPAACKTVGSATVAAFAQSYAFTDYKSRHPHRLSKTIYFKNLTINRNYSRTQYVSTSVDPSKVVLAGISINEWTPTKLGRSYGLKPGKITHRGSVNGT